MAELSGGSHLENDLIRHNLVVFRGGDNALQVRHVLVNFMESNHALRVRDDVLQVRHNLVVFRGRDNALQVRHTLVVCREGAPGVAREAQPCLSSGGGRKCVAGGARYTLCKTQCRTSWQRHNLPPRPSPSP